MFQWKIHKAPNISQNLTKHISPSAAISEAISRHHSSYSPLESWFDFYALSSWESYTVSEADPIASHKVQTCHPGITRDFQAHREESLRERKASASWLRSPAFSALPRNSQRLFSEADMKADGSRLQNSCCLSCLITLQLTSKKQLCEQGGQCTEPGPL